MDSKLSAKVVEYFGRKSVALTNEQVHTIIDAWGGMMPEFSLRKGKGGLNSHWIPDFRDTSGKKFTTPEQAEYWKARLLYLICGDFPCGPNFGVGGMTDGVDLPPHGWMANNEWSIDKCGLAPDKDAAVVRFSLKSPDKKMPLSWTKCDMLLENQNAYYSIIRIKNKGKEPISVNIARHNTLGSPFLQAGCQISLSADLFQVVPMGTEFDNTGRLLPGAQFSSLKEVACRDGSKADISIVPGMIGYSDLITGAISKKLSLGWSCVVNPVLGLAYISFFPGLANLPSDEVALGFNDLWMQYGGRDFPPWALYEGGYDRTFCLGAENSIGYFANGLDYSRKNPELLGNPTTITVPAGGEKKLCYGTALVALEKKLIEEGVQSIEAAEGKLIVKGKKTSQSLPLDACFTRARKIEDAE